jgi:hypothetical protein
LQSSLGIEVDGGHPRITFHHPTLPEFLREVKITGLPLGDTRVNIVVHGEGDQLTVGAEGDSDVQIIVNS